MTQERIIQLIRQGEGLHCEYKQATQATPKTLFDTICAFLNREGGTILLGVTDSGDIVGVSPESVEKLKKDIVTQSNNSQKLEPPCLLFPLEIELENRTVLALRINLIEAYDALMTFTANYLPDTFFLEGDIRVSLREKIFREVVANLLVHREYTNAYPATFIIYADRVEVKNANNPHGQGLLALCPWCDTAVYRRTPLSDHHPFNREESRSKGAAPSFAKEPLCVTWKNITRPYRQSPPPTGSATSYAQGILPYSIQKPPLSPTNP